MRHSFSLKLLVRERGCARGGADRSLTLAAPEIRGGAPAAEPTAR
jgi:hypothetical protein